MSLALHDPGNPAQEYVICVMLRWKGVTGQFLLRICPLKLHGLTLCTHGWHGSQFP